MRPWKRRALILAGGTLALTVASVFFFQAFNSNIAFYVTPSELAAGQIPQGKVFRVGGMVKAGSLQRDGLVAHFRITDTSKDVAITYTGILPDLFKEAKGAVVEGKLLPDGTFEASQVLAKHDENYMPPAAQAAIDAVQPGNIYPR